MPAKCTEEYRHIFEAFLIREGQLQFDMNDEITKETMMTRDGEIIPSENCELLA